MAERDCLCGCGGAVTGDSVFRQGHDLRLAMGLIRHTYGTVGRMAEVFPGAADLARRENLGKV